MAKRAFKKLRQLHLHVDGFLKGKGELFEGTTPLTAGLRAVRFCGHVYHGFIKNRAPIRAAALAYTTVLALVPMLAIAISISTSLLKKERDTTIPLLIERFVASVAPMLTAGTGDDTSPESRINRQEAVGRIQEYVNNVIGYIDEVKSGTLGVTAVLVLVFIAISLLSTIESTFNDVWAVRRGRTWMSRIISYWAGLTLGPLLLLTALGLTSAGQFEVVRDWLERVEIVGIFIFRFFIPFMILSLAFSALYLFLPNTKVDWRAAVVGGTVAGCLLQLNSLCSVVYGSRAVTYSKIYGSLAVVPLFLVGLYLSWTIILLGAQVAYVFQFRNEEHEDKHAETVHQRGRELAALQLMTWIGRQFQSGSAPSTASEISRELGLPFKLVLQILSLLTKNQLLLEVADATQTFSPARPLDTIRAQDILRAIRIGEGRDLPPTTSRAHLLARTELEAIEHSEAQRSASVTLKDLVDQTLAPLSAENGVQS